VIFENPIFSTASKKLNEASLLFFQSNRGFSINPKKKIRNQEI
jgi:hypothetical protein